MRYYSCQYLLLCLALPAHAGIALSGTRVIYPADNKEVTLAVISSDTDTRPYLIQSFVDNSGPEGKEQSTDKAPFIITPPLFRLEAGQQSMLRIVKTGGALPEDRESVFWINVKAIPADDPGMKGQNVLKMSIKNRIKLFYRPTSPVFSDSDVQGRFHGVKFRKIGKQLQVTNPTPYYLTFFSLSAGNAPVDTTNMMVPPKGSISYSLPDNSSDSIHWQWLNDFGVPSTKEKSTLQ